MGKMIYDVMIIGGGGAGLFPAGNAPAVVEPRTAEDIIEMIKSLIPAKWD